VPTQSWQEVCRVWLSIQTIQASDAVIDGDLDDDISPQGRFYFWPQRAQRKNFFALSLRRRQGKTHQFARSALFRCLSRAGGAHFIPPGGRWMPMTLPWIRTSSKL
jgi:hypothetical protein